MEKKTNKVKIINRTTFEIKNIKNIVSALLEGQPIPNFYLFCEPLDCKGITLTNLDKPTIIIFVRDLKQLAETFVHELVHLQQHSKGYVNEDEATEREVIVSDKDNPEGINWLKGKTQ